MKKIILSIAALMFVFMATDCGKKGPLEHAQQRLKRMDSYSADGTQIGYSLFEYDPGNRLLNMTSYIISAPSLSNRVNFEYFPDGRLNTINTYDSTGALAETDVYVYGADGKLNTKNAYDGSMALQGWKAYKYSADSRLVTRTAFSAAGVAGNFNVYEYDAQGRVVKMTPYVPPGVAGSYLIYTYGSNGMMQKQETYDVTDVLTMYDSFDYNEYRELVKAWYYSPPAAVYSYAVPAMEAGKANYVFTDLLTILQ